MKVILQNVDTYTNATNDGRGQKVLRRLSEMNNIALTVASLNTLKNPPPSGAVLKDLIETVGQDIVTSGTRALPKQLGMFAL